jgi:hypothetical protein
MLTAETSNIGYAEPAPAPQRGIVQKFRAA